MKGTYVDGFVLVVSRKNLAAYKKMAQTAERVWKKYGAIDYKECVMEDPKPKWVTLTFGKMLKVKPAETAVFSYITYKNRKHRDEVNAKVMKDPFMQPPKSKNKKKEQMPFDMKRLAYAGFDVIVGA